jgi:molybdate transport system ATP-binding protein
MIKIDIHKKLHGAYGDMDLDVNLEIQKGEFIALMGESGSGKTTLLRVLAGLENAEGDIAVEDVLWLGNRKMLPPQQREIGFIFQDYALFENMNVEENLLFVNDDKALAQRLLQMTELRRLSHRNVKGLSGGQKQRVSLCRAMMKQPKLLLMDEPLSALDPAMRSKLQDEILKLHKTFGTTTIMVSHDADASYYLSDRILVLDHGKIIADGRPQEIFVKTSKEIYTLSR